MADYTMKMEIAGEEHILFISQPYPGYWSVITDNYDGAPDAGRQLIGSGDSLQQALDDFIFNAEEMATPEPDDSMDGDHESALASAGWGTDEDYGGGDDRF